MNLKILNNHSQIKTPNVFVDYLKLFYILSLAQTKIR